MKVKFWTRVNGGCVKVKLEPGESLEHVAYINDDEGYEATATLWHWPGVGESVVRSVRIDSRDCDGRFQRHYVDQCDVALLKMEVPDGSWWTPHPDAEWFRDHDGVTFPTWTEVSDSQRDFRAEAFGY